MTETETPTIPEPAEAAPRSLYRYSLWVHVGAGAEDCSEVDERTGENRCGNPEHFHAWCRLPNEFQENSIRERALAAKARKLRQIRTNGSDINEILESDLEEILAGPDSKEKLAGELVGADWADDYLTAVKVVRDLDDEGEGAEEGAKLYGHIDEDQARYERLRATPEDERSQDEFDELAQHIGAYQAAVHERYEAITGPKHESYTGMADTDLVDLVRQRRIKAAANAEFMHHYSINEWLSCTFRAPGPTGLLGELVFKDLAQLETSPNGVLQALAEVYADLERTAQEALGN